LVRCNDQRGLHQEQNNHSKRLCWPHQLKMD
jgi:hypothetical protein